MMSLVVRIRNISSLAPVSDYEYDVIVGGDTNYQTIAAGKVYGHKRADGWQALVRKVLKAERKPPLTPAQR